jgi:hypothetical protein
VIEKTYLAMDLTEPTTLRFVFPLTFAVGSPRDDANPLLLLFLGQQL